MRAGEDVLVALRQAAQMAPGSPSVFNLASRANQQDRPQEALDALLTLNPERGWLRDWVPYWTEMAQALHVLGEHEQELEASRRCRQLHPELFDCLRFQAYALAALGRIDELNGIMNEINGSPQLMEEDETIVMLDPVDVLRANGHREAAQKAAERAVDWFEANPLVEPRVRQDYGRSLFLAGRLEEAQNLFDALVEDSLLLGDRYFEAEVRGLRGVIAATRGDSVQARDDLAWLESRDESYPWNVRFFRGAIAGALGEKERAVESLRQAFAEISFTPWVRSRAELDPLRDYPPFQELLRPKG